MNETVHILNKGAYKTLCGLKKSFFCTWLKAESEQWGSKGYPTCEACILLHFHNPEDTFNY